MSKTKNGVTDQTTPPDGITDETPAPPPQTVLDRFWELYKEIGKGDGGQAAANAAALLTATEALCGELSEMTGRIQMLEDAWLGLTPVEMVDDQGSVVPTSARDVIAAEPDICRRLDRIAYALEAANQQRSEAVDAAVVRAENPPKGE